MNGSMIRQTPITCTGHSRPVVDIEFSDITDDLSYYLISASKDGKPQLREGGTGNSKFFRVLLVYYKTIFNPRQLQ